MRRSKVVSVETNTKTASLRSVSHSVLKLAVAVSFSG